MLSCTLQTCSKPILITIKALKSILRSGVSNYLKTRLGSFPLHPGQRLTHFFIHLDGASTSLDSPSAAIASAAADHASSESVSAMHPRLHRQKLQSKNNRGKNFRSFKSGKAVANIEVILTAESKFFLIHRLSWNYRSIRCRTLKWSRNKSPYRPSSLQLAQLQCQSTASRSSFCWCLAAEVMSGFPESVVEWAICRDVISLVVSRGVRR